MKSMKIISLSPKIVIQEDKKRFFSIGIQCSKAETALAISEYLTKKNNNINVLNILRSLFYSKKKLARIMLNYS